MGSERRKEERTGIGGRKEENYTHKHRDTHTYIHTETHTNIHHTHMHTKNKIL